MLKKSKFVVLAILMALVLAPGAFAALQRVGPVDIANGGYPAWYQDTTGLALEFCEPSTQAELNDGWCLILNADVPTGAVPEVPFSNYSVEHFYWAATAGDRTTAILVLSLEAAFNTADPVPGEQIVFGRLRITIPSLPVDGDYRVYTPFGDFDFPGLTAGDRLFFTSDIGIACGSDFNCALTSQIGPFLLPSATPGGVEVPPIPDLVAGSGVDPFYDSLADPNIGGGATPYPATGKKYIADPARIGPVTGSPLPDFVGNDGLTYNHNIFRVETSNGDAVISEPNFILIGRVMEAAIPAKTHIDRASYSSSATADKLDVFATASPGSQGRLPGSTQQPATTSPSLGYFEAPCATDPVTGVVTGPPTTTTVYFSMANSGSNWWGQSSPTGLPLQVCVQDTGARNAAGQVVTAYYLADVTDEVSISQAEWNQGILTVTAASSDTLFPPELTLTWPGMDTALVIPSVPGSGTFTVPPILAPPPKVRVQSSYGGFADLLVTTAIGPAVIPDVPMANPDAVSILEDAAATLISPLGNDTYNDLPIPAGATIDILQLPQLGTAVINLDNTITYTPSLNKNGTDLIGYTVTVGTAVSIETYITITIIPVNDLPAANNDTLGAANNQAVTFNLLVNDTDPDGAADLANAVIVTQPTPAGATVNGGAGGLVTFTATNPGTYTFTYQAQDQALALSNIATVTVNVSGAENIGIQKSQYVISKNRWRVEGTDNVIAGQTLTIAYDNGTFADGSSAAGYPIGTAVVTAAGAWALDTVGTGRLNPADATVWSVSPTRIRVTSPLGGLATANISLKN